MQAWSIIHIMLTEIDVPIGTKQLFKTVKCSYVVIVSNKNKLHINSSVDFSLGTCS